MIALVLTPPDAVGLPAAERADAPPSQTRALVADRWPEIERLVSQDRIEQALRALEALAAEMRDATARDAPLFGDALTLSRRVLYDALVEVGRAGGREAEARSALARCAVWDEELRGHLETLLETDLLQLALRYVDLRREGDAIPILERAVQRAPEPGLARLWLAHAYLRGGADTERAVSLLESLLGPDPELDAAARMLLAEARASLSLDERTRLLVESVERRPHWVANRERLAMAYRDAGRYAEALDQIDDALRNATGVHPEAAFVLRMFETTITGRGASDAGDRLRRERKRIEAGAREAGGR